MGELTAPTAAAALEALTPDEALGLWRALVLPRAIEDKMLNLLRRGQLSKWFSGIGQEAVSVGLVAALRPDDWILPVHRNLAVFTASCSAGPADTPAGAIARSTSARSSTTSSA